MPVEGAVIAEALDSLGWSVFLLDVAAYNMTADAVRVEAEKDEADMAVFMINRNQYRYAKQYVGPIRKALPHSLLAASTDLPHLREWLPELNFCIFGHPSEIVLKLASRTETKNFDDIPIVGGPVKDVRLPQYHPLTTHFERHAQIRGGRFADIPTTLFGDPVPLAEALRTVCELRMKYAAQGFHLTGPLTKPTEWLGPLMKGLEDKELVGEPANLTWTCEIPNPIELTNILIREMGGHGCKAITLRWVRGQEKEVERAIDRCNQHQIQTVLELEFGELNKYDYLAMGEFLAAHEQVPAIGKFAVNASRLDDEAYVSSLSNGFYPPKSMSLHADIELLGIRDCVLNRDTERLRQWTK